jgi:hypothetical protein
VLRKRNTTTDDPKCVNNAADADDGTDATNGGGCNNDATDDAADCGFCYYLKRAGLFLHNV